MLSPHLRRHGDDLAMGLPSLLARQFRECGTDLVRARRITTPWQYSAAAARLVSYHASFAFRPLASARTVTIGIRVNGLQRPVVVRNNTSDLHIFRDIFLYEALANLPLDGIADARTIVDLGSNIGLASSYLSCWARKAVFYCAEPAAESMSVARRNAEVQGIDAVFDQVAISDHDGSIELYPNKWWASCSTVRSVISARTSDPERFESDLALPSVTVPASRVSSFLERHGIENVDLIKIDIEGAEEEVFCGDTDWLDAVRVLGIEIHSKYVDAEPIIATLRKHGLKQRSGAGPLDVFAR